MKKYHLLKVSAFTVALVLGLGGCASSSAAPESSASTTASAGESASDSSQIDLSSVTLRVAQTGWGSFDEALKAAGVSDTPYKVEYTIFQGGNLCLQAMAAGQVDFSASSETPPIFAATAENQGNFKIVAVSHATTLLQELVVAKDSPIKTVADLKGKRVGYINATTAQYFLLKMLQNAGLKWEDIQAEQLTTADGVTALVGGKIDAFASYGNSINAAKANGATTLESAKDILSGYFPYEASTTALEDDGKRAAIVDYLTRVEKSNEWKRGNPEAWAKISAKPQGLTEEQALEIFKNGEEQRETHVLAISDEVIASEQDLSDTFLSVGLLKEKQDVKAFYSDALTEGLTKALK